MYITPQRLPRTALFDLMWLSVPPRPSRMDLLLQKIVSHVSPITTSYALSTSTHSIDIAPHPRTASSIGSSLLIVDNRGYFIRRYSHVAEYTFLRLVGRPAARLCTLKQPSPIDFRTFATTRLVAFIHPLHSNVIPATTSSRIRHSALLIQSSQVELASTSVCHQQ
jgi:hypothetical protein